MLALSSRKIDKYHFLTGEEILSSSNQRKIAEQAKFSYSALGKAFEKTNRKSGWCSKISRPF